MGHSITLRVDGRSRRMHGDHSLLLRIVGSRVRISDITGRRPDL
jgi:hypothetical protein